MTGSGDTIVVADVGNTRIKLAVVAEAGNGAGRALPTVGSRQDLLSREFRAANLEAWLGRVAPGASGAGNRATASHTTHAQSTGVEMANTRWMPRATSTPAGHQALGWSVHGGPPAARIFQSLIRRTSISNTTSAATSAATMNSCSRLWAA